MPCANDGIRGIPRKLGGIPGRLGCAELVTVPYCLSEPLLCFFLSLSCFFNLFLPCLPDEELLSDELELDEELLRLRAMEV